MKLTSFLFLGLCSSELVNEKVSRVLDASTQLLRSSASVVIRNDGEEEVSTIQLAADAVNVNRLIYLVAKIDNKKQTLSVDYKINLEKPLAKGDKVTIEVEEIYHGAVRAFPSEIKQQDNQLVVVEINLYHSSPYRTLVQNSRMNIGTKKTESFSKQGKLDGQAVKFDEQTNAGANAVKKVRVHFENNNSFLVAERVEREIEVSHWGNVAITDKIWLRHNGAILKGPFSRFDYQRQDSGPFVAKWKMTLPAEAADVYYRDLIGNISTSNLRVDYAAGETSLELVPRFPMFGGWRNHFTIGYNVPSSSFLSKQGSKFRIQLPAVPDLYENFIIEELDVKFVLPEGAESISFRSTTPMKQGEKSNRYTFLDTTGRVVVNAKGTYLTADHKSQLTLTYEWNSLLIFKEPLLAISGWLVFFLLALFIARLDYSIATVDQAKKKQ